MVRTPRAQALRTEVHALVERAQAVFAPPGVPDLSRLERTFTVLAEDVAVMLGPELLARLRAEAPGVALRFLGESPAAESLQLRDGPADLDIGVIHEPPPEIRVEPLRTMHMAVVVRAGHPLTRGELTPERYAAADHVSASRRGRATGPADDALARLGLTRRVALVVPTYAAAALVVARTDLVALAARELSAHVTESQGLVALEPPIPLPPHLGQDLAVRADHVDHRPDDVGGPGAGRVEHGKAVRDDLVGLRGMIAGLADHLAGEVDRALAGEVREPAAAGNRHVAIAGRLVNRSGIELVDHPCIIDTIGADEQRLPAEVAEFVGEGSGRAVRVEGGQAYDGLGAFRRWSSDAEG